MRGFLQDARPGIVAAAVEALNHLKCVDARGEILALLKHSAAEVVGSVLRFMTSRFPKDAVPLLEEALESPQALLRETAADELGELGYTPALPIDQKSLEGLRTRSPARQPGRR